MAVVHTLVSDVEKVVEGLRQRYGEFTFAMLYNRSLDADTSWNLIVSSPWLDDMTLTEATSLAAHELHLKLELENKAAISRVTVLKTSDPFVRDMIYFHRAAKPGTPIPVGQLTVGDVTGSGFILYSPA